MLPQLEPLPECSENYCWILTSRGKEVDRARRAPARRVARSRARSCGRADVFITNLHPSVLQKLGMALGGPRAREPAADLRARDRLRRPRADEVEKPGYDATAWWARSGLMDAVRPRGAEFALADRRAVGDHPSADGAVQRDRARALRPREERGRASACAPSLVANGAWSNSILIQAALCGAKTVRAADPRGHRERAREPLRVLVTGAACTWRWCRSQSSGERFTSAIGRPELRDDPRFKELRAAPRERRRWSRSSTRRSPRSRSSPGRGGARPTRGHVRIIARSRTCRTTATLRERRLPAGRRQRRAPGACAPSTARSSSTARKGLARRAPKQAATRDPWRRSVTRRSEIRLAVQAVW